MRRLAVLAVLALVPVSAASADGCPPSQCGTATVAVPGSQILALRPDGGTGPLIAYDLAARSVRFSLPAGVASADGKRFAVLRFGKRDTTMQLFHARTGLRLRTARLPGRWFVSAVSPDGRFAAAIATRHRGGRTTLGLVDLPRGRLVRTVSLRGTFEVEAVSPRGDRFFLIRWLSRGYVVQSLDLATRRLAILRVKGEPTLMDGTAWSAVPSPEGRWLLTLYLASAHREVAVHTLDLVRGKAVCIDLPWGSIDAVQRYVVVPTADGRRAYAANPVLGVVAELDLARSKVVATRRFRVSRPSRPTAFGPTGAISRDGRFVAFSPGSGVWVYDTRSGRVRGPFAVDPQVIGLGFAPDGRLVAVRPDRTAIVVPAD